ncbi:MAG TPA: class I SAM-dependent methyltransferase [Polyangiaceae bacterium]|nr:class I SAM-dependent methyltransferase [Polyangiaceae bacterium]
MEPSYYATFHRVQERHWWYAARRTILKGVLEELHDRGLPPGSLYDLGCGVGANLPVLERFGPTVGVDTSENAVAFCKGRGHDNVAHADLNRLDGFADGSGSVVVLADVIEHLDDESPCLRAARRLLAPGGALVVTVPAFSFLWGPSDEVAQHRRRYTEASLRAAIEPLFRVERTTYFNTLLFAPIAAGRLLERVLKRPGTETAEVPSPAVNLALRSVFAAEAPLVRKLHLPFGVSLLCVARKPAE